MTSLVSPNLGTDRDRGWMYYSIHLAASYVLKEFFLASNYRDCLRAAETPVNEIGRWAIEMRDQHYHELHTHAFVGMWSAFEVGIEDTVASIVRHDRQAAAVVVGRFKKDRYPIDAWPWTASICTEIAQKLEQKSKEATPNGGVDLFARVRTIFSWLDVVVDDDPIISDGLAEANRMRNIILHRYGQVSAEDAAAIPSLLPWIGKVMPIDHERFAAYNKAISACLVALMIAVSKSRHAT